MQELFNAIGEFLDDVKGGAGSAAQKFADLCRELADWADAQAGGLAMAAPPGAAPAGLAACKQKLAECEAHCRTAMAAPAAVGVAAAWDGSRVLQLLAVVKQILALFG